MAKNLCPKCGVNLDMVGSAHRCIERVPVTGPRPKPLAADFKEQPEIVAKDALRSERIIVDDPELLPEAEKQAMKAAYNKFMREYMRKWRAKRKVKND